MKNRKDFLKETIKHIDIKEIDTTKIVEAMKSMSFSARDLARSAELYDKMLYDKDCTVILALSGSTSAAGCMQVYVDMVKNNMVDAIVATGASVVDMDFFEALGYKHYKGDVDVDNAELGELGIDRIYDTYTDDKELEKCGFVIAEIADNLEKRPYSSREFIWEMGRFLENNPNIAKKKDSLIQWAFKKNIPIFCPAFSDCAAGFGLVKHQTENLKNHLTIDSVRDFRELAKLKMNTKETGVVIIGGGTPKNFLQDVVVCTEYSGKFMPRHKYAIQITVADVRDGGCSSSTFKEARTWGKVELDNEQMVYAEATLAFPLIASYAYHKGNWKGREDKKLSNLFLKSENEKK
ncbi:MAG TPA: deoxyhypusine synthase [Candidatus Moranbacteria bacterium]|nr:deoxyhypusine synthase [Candidatus Moranbacteria bacterium]HRZ33313.1 deoxyhypusine synthase [Candidatus Moranbacteria bacterium]